MLNCHFIINRWDVEKLTEKYFEDPDKIANAIVSAFLGLLALGAALVYLCLFIIGSVSR